MAWRRFGSDRECKITMSDQKKTKLWFTGFNGNRIGRITTSGVITEYPIPTQSSGPEGISAGPDGDLWFVESFSNKIAKFIP